MLYYGAIILASIFAFLAQKIKYYKNGKKGVHPLFWILSFVCLLVPVAFRGNGVDHQSYIKFYNAISEFGLNYFKIYNGFPEPLFVVINVIAGYLGDFQYVYMISAFISLFFTYKAFARKIEEISLPLCIFLFSTLFYLTLFGLVRICIAVGIITYAYRYIEERNLMKYSIYIIFATLFHYSAIIMLPFYFIFKSNYLDLSKKSSIKKSLLSIGALVLAFVIVGYLLTKLQNISWIGRYFGYFEGTSLRVINNAAGQYPLVILMFLFGSRIKRNEKYGSLYTNMFITMIIFLVGSIFVSFTRLTYFLYPATYYLYACVVKYIENKNVRILYLFALYITMTFWFFYQFTSNLWLSFLIPYYFNISF